MAFGFVNPVSLYVNPVGPWSYPISVLMDIGSVPPDIVFVYPNIFRCRRYRAIDFYICRFLVYITCGAANEEG